MTWVVVYLRVSTLRQGVSRLGIETQREAVARHVASTGGRILGEVVKIESGKQIARPELARVLATRQRMLGRRPSRSGCHGRVWGSAPQAPTLGRSTGSCFVKLTSPPSARSLV